jgi:hypothetical protein
MMGVLDIHKTTKTKSSFVCHEKKCWINNSTVDNTYTQLDLQESISRPLTIRKDEMGEQNLFLTACYTSSEHNFFMAVYPLHDTVRTCIHTACRTSSKEMS